MQQFDFVRAWKIDTDYDIDGPVIVLTIEELRKVFEAGEDKGADRVYEDEGMDHAVAGAHNFETYLKSKGIQI